MLSTLLLTAALTVAQGEDGKLEIANPRATYGHLGAVRPKGGLMPGDVAHFTFDLKNLKCDASGRAQYSVAIDVTNSKGEIIYQQQPHNAVAQNFLGGNSLPCTAQIEVPLDAVPGETRWKVTIHDRLAKQSAVLEGKGMVLKPDFSIIRVGTFADGGGRVPSPPIGVVGETLYINFATINFARKAGQPDLSVQMRILDENGKPTIPQPLTGQIKKNVPEGLRVLPMQFAVSMNRPGRFTVELTARCELCDRTSTVTFPIRVLPME